MGIPTPGAGRSRQARPTSHLAVGLQLAGAGLILAGAFTPWVRSQVLFLTLPVSGIKTDYGRIFPFLALGVYGLLAYQWSYGWRRWASGVVVLLGAIALILALLFAVRITQRIARLTESTQNQPLAPFVVPGGRPYDVALDAGYFMTLIGVGGLLAGAVMDWRARPAPDGR